MMEKTLPEGSVFSLMKLFNLNIRVKPVIIRGIKVPGEEAEGICSGNRQRHAEGFLNGQAAGKAYGETGHHAVSAADGVPGRDFRRPAVENTLITGEKGALFAHGKNDIGNTGTMELRQGLHGFHPAEDTVSGQLRNLVFIRLDEEGLFLYRGNQAAAAGIHKNRNAGCPAETNQFAVKIRRDALRHAAADGDHIGFRKAGAEIGEETADILLRDGLAGFQVFRARR